MGEIQKGFTACYQKHISFPSSKKLAFHLKTRIVKDRKCQFPNMARTQVVTFRSVPSSYIHTPGVRVSFIQEMVTDIFKFIAYSDHWKIF